MYFVIIDISELKLIVRRGSVRRCRADRNLDLFLDERGDCGPFDGRAVRCGASVRFVALSGWKGLIGSALNLATFVRLMTLSGWKGWIEGAAGRITAVGSKALISLEVLSGSAAGRLAAVGSRSLISLEVFNRSATVCLSLEGGYLWGVEGSARGH